MYVYLYVLSLPDDKTFCKRYTHLTQMGNFATVEYKIRFLGCRSNGLPGGDGDLLLAHDHIEIFNAFNAYAAWC